MTEPSAPSRHEETAEASDPATSAASGRSVKSARWRGEARTLGVLVALGCLAGVVWWLTTPRYQAYFAAGIWYNPEQTDFWVRQDVGFALCTAVVGLGVAVWQVAGLARRAPITGRFLVALAGSLLGAAAAWAVGTALGWRAHPAQGEMGPAALQLHALSLLVVWPALVSLIVALALLWITWTSPDAEPGIAQEARPDVDGEHTGEPAALQSPHDHHTGPA